MKSFKNKVKYNTYCNIFKNIWKLWCILYERTTFKHSKPEVFTKNRIHAKILTLCRMTDCVRACVCVCLIARSQSGSSMNQAVASLDALHCQSKILKFHCNASERLLIIPHMHESQLQIRLLKALAVSLSLALVSLSSAPSLPHHETHPDVTSIILLIV